jgi:hypothetical protein
VQAAPFKSVVSVRQNQVWDCSKERKEKRKISQMNLDRQATSDKSAPFVPHTFTILPLAMKPPSSKMQCCAQIYCHQSSAPTIRLVDRVHDKRHNVKCTFTVRKQKREPT